MKHFLVLLSAWLGVDMAVVPGSVMQFKDIVAVVSAFVETFGEALGLGVEVDGEMVMRMTRPSWGLVEGVDKLGVSRVTRCNFLGFQHLVSIHIPLTPLKLAPAVLIFLHNLLLVVFFHSSAFSAFNCRANLVSRKCCVSAPGPAAFTGGCCVLD